MTHHAKSAGGFSVGLLNLRDHSIGQEHGFGQRAALVELAADRLESGFGELRGGRTVGFGGF